MATTFERFFDPIPAPGNIYAAYALGVLEYAAYRNDAALIASWARIFGLPISGVVETPDRVTPNIAYAGDSRRMVLAIPGTVNGKQMLNNILYSAQRDTMPAFGAGRAHSFFLWCAEGIVDAIRDSLITFPDLREVCFVGHSLGGAVAQLMADWVTINTGVACKYVCTFNAPRVGDGQWAERSRPYPTHVYYNTHDLVCELPPNFIPSTAGWETDLGFLDGFKHRDDLIAIPSLNDIQESWMAIGISKLAYPLRSLTGFLWKGATAAHVMRGMSFIGSRAALASWVLPVPAWVIEHFMVSVLENIEAVTTFAGMPEHRQLKIMQDFLKSSEPTPNGGSTFPFALAPPGAFANGADPGDGTLTDLPVISAGTRFETIEAAFQWIDVEDAVYPTRMISVDDAFFDALTRRAAVVPGNNPLTAPGQAVVDLPVRVHWLMRGQDRRLLTKLAKCMELCRVRDDRRLDPTPAAGLSTRTPIIDDFDDEVAAAVELIEARVYELLSLRLETP